MTRYTSQIFVDESGTAKQTPYVVFGALKIGTDLGLLVNELDHLRYRMGVRAEAKFSNTNNTTVQFHKEMVSLVHASRARFSAVVIERDNDGFAGDQWRSQAFYTVEAIRFAMSDDERTAAIVDHISVPREVNFENYVHSAVNDRYGADDRRVVSVVRMSSEACWGLQMADLLTGAVHFAHRLAKGDQELNPGSLRGQLADHVRGAFNVPSLNEASSPRFRVREMFKG